MSRPEIVCSATFSPYEYSTLKEKKNVLGSHIRLYGLALMGFSYNTHLLVYASHRPFRVENNPLEVIWQLHYCSPVFVYRFMCIIHIQTCYDACQT